MKKLTFEHLAPYLPYKVLVGDGRTPFELTEHNITNCYRYVTEIYLRPLSDLTKEIEHNGEKFVPIEKIGNGTYNYGGYTKEGFLTLLNYDPLNAKYYAVQKLLEWHFDVFGLIPDLAIDINKI